MVTQSYLHVRNVYLNVSRGESFVYASVGGKKNAAGSGIWRQIGATRIQSVVGSRTKWRRYVLTFGEKCV